MLRQGFDPPLLHQLDFNHLQPQATVAALVIWPKSDQLSRSETDGFNRLPLIRLNHPNTTHRYPYI